VELKNNLGVVIATTTTNASGAYTFTNLSAGTYAVVETDLPGYVSTTLNSIAVTLSAGTNATLNYGDQTVAGNPLIADPAVTKLGSPTSAVIGDVVVYTITVGNNGNTNATGVVLTDTKPAFLDIIAISISPNPGLTPVISGNTFTINFGTVTPTDFFTITVLTRVNAQGVPPGGVNNAAIVTNSGTDRTVNNASSALLSIPSTRGGVASALPVTALLPATGFAPNAVTNLPVQPSNMLYAATDLLLEIPRLGVKMPIVGVAKKNGAWDVTWLGKQAGWLEGTAFPSWNGNSVLTGHVYDSNGLPGPFVNLSTLKYGDKIIVHAYGQKYTFEIRTNQIVAPNDISVLKHEEKAWLTLVTCKEYDEKTNTYKQRVVVRAILVSVDWDK
jgi:LPXTG-site transpeptidase (sortase) family protein